MSDMPEAYVPDKVTVKAGETVRWVNAGKSNHAVMLVPADAQTARDASEPSGAKTFDSGFVPPGGSFEHKFTVPGVYHYFCNLHEKAGMVGVVVVKK